MAGMPGRVFSRYELVNRVRGYEYVGYERSIDSHVKNLRRKLGPDGAAAVATVVGVGYRLGWATGLTCGVPVRWAPGSCSRSRWSASCR